MPRATVTIRTEDGREYIINADAEIPGKWCPCDVVAGTWLGSVESVVSVDEEAEAADEAADDLAAFDFDGVSDEEADAAFEAADAEGPDENDDERDEG